MKNIQAKIDERYMAAAIRLARKNEGLTGTNPSVACVLVKQINGNNIIIGSGVTAKGGRPHAEPIALEQAAEIAAEHIAGATAYVTLEPCAHHGATPPCAATLIDAGIARVVTAHIDPDDRVNELGHKMLRDAKVDVQAGCLPEKAINGLSSYLNHKHNNRAYVTLKIALSADGYIGIKGQGQVAITGEVANSQTHLLRARHHAILVGAQTVIEDNPSLTCRLNGLGERSPIRLILDPNGRVPLDAEVFQTANVVTTKVIAPFDLAPKRRAELAALNVGIINCHIVNGEIALPEFLEDLASIGIISVMVEGGAKTAKSFLNAGLVNEVFLLKGPNEIGKNTIAIKAPINDKSISENFEKDNVLYLGEDTMSHYICKRIYNSAKESN